MNKAINTEIFKISSSTYQPSTLLEVCCWPTHQWRLTCQKTVLLLQVTTTFQKHSTISRQTTSFVTCTSLVSTHMSGLGKCQPRCGVSVDFSIDSSQNTQPSRLWQSAVWPRRSTVLRFALAASSRPHRVWSFVWRYPSTVDTSPVLLQGDVRWAADNNSQTQQNNAQNVFKCFNYRHSCHVFYVLACFIFLNNVSL